MKKSTNLSYFHSQLVRRLINTIVNNKPNCSFVNLAQYLVNFNEVHIQVLRGQCVTSKQLCLLESNIKDV